MDISRYRDLFVSEAREHLTALGSLSVRCEKGETGSSIINELFRHAHSLKGMAATMQLDPIAILAHALRSAGQGSLRLPDHHPQCCRPDTGRHRHSGAVGDTCG